MHLLKQKHPTQPTREGVRTARRSLRDSSGCTGSTPSASARAAAGLGDPAAVLPLPSALVVAPGAPDSLLDSDIRTRLVSLPLRRDARGLALRPLVRPIAPASAWRRIGQRCRSAVQGHGTVLHLVVVGAAPPASLRVCNETCRSARLPVAMAIPRVYLSLCGTLPLALLIEGRLCIQASAGGCVLDRLGRAASRFGSRRRDSCRGARAVARRDCRLCLRARGPGSEPGAARAPRR